MKNRNEHEEACRRVTARFQPGFLKQYVTRKLRSDPSFPAVYDAVRFSQQPLLDVGCGVGLLGFYLRERGFENPVIGLDRAVSKIRAGQQIATAYSKMDLRLQNLSDRLPEFCGTIALLDVLHYFGPADQKNLLSRLVEQIAPGAQLILRDCPHDRTVRYAMTVLAEKFAQMISWNVSGSLHFPSRERIIENFSPNEFTHEVRPLWGATPFNNHLFIFRRRSSAVVPSMG